MSSFTFKGIGRRTFDDVAKEDRLASDVQRGRAEWCTANDPRKYPRQCPWSGSVFDITRPSGRTRGRFLFFRPFPDSGNGSGRMGL